jgi:hypothetical protein
MLEFLLDGQAVTEPEGLTQLRHRIYFNTGLNGYLEQFDGPVMFYGDQYKYLRNRLFVDGCAIAEVVIRNGIDTYRGNIFLNDAEWEPDLGKVTCEIVDASFLSLIDNNKDIKAYLNVPRSKNDVDISAFTVTQTDLVFKEHEIGVDTPTPPNRSGVRVYDAFKFLLAFMSDGQIGFASNYFLPETNPANATAARNPTLITGHEIREGDDEIWPYISFQQLYEDINKLYNVSFSMETVNGVPTMRIEPRSYYTASTAVSFLQHANGVKQSCVRESYYQLMKFGDSGEADNSAFYRPITFRGWTKEEYHLGGQCNTKEILDLQLKTVIINTNTIQGCLPYGAGNPQNQINPPYDNYEEDTFLVIFDGNNETVTNVTPAFPAYQYYNARLFNSEVADRWVGAVPFPIFLFLGANLNGARAARTFDYTPPYIPISLITEGAFFTFNSTAFPEGFDPNGNVSFSTANYSLAPTVTYNGGNTIYTAPINSIYTVSVRILLNPFIDYAAIANIFMVRFDSINALGLEYIVVPIAGLSFQGGVWVWEGSYTFYCDAGDRLAIMGVNTDQILSGSYFQVNDAFEVTKTYDVESNWLLKSECMYPIPADWWRNFRNNWHQLITMTYNTGQASGYVDEISRPIYSGDAEVSIVSKFANVTR